MFSHEMRRKVTNFPRHTQISPMNFFVSGIYSKFSHVGFVNSLLYFI